MGIASLEDSEDSTRIIEKRQLFTPGNFVSIVVS